MLLSNDASRNWISFLEEFWFATASYRACSKKWWNFRPGVYIRGGWSIRTSCKFRYKLWSWSCALWPSAKAQECSCKEGLVQRMAKFLPGSVCRKYCCSDRQNFLENFRNSMLMNEICYVDKNHPLKTKCVRNHTCPFFDDELRTMKRSRRKFGKAFRKNGNSQARSRFLNAVFEFFELFSEKKSEYLEKCDANENKRVRYSILQQLIEKK